MSVGQYKTPPPGLRTCPECNTVDGADIWVVIDHEGAPDLAVSYPEAAHEHINEAIGCGIEGAGKWVVRQYRQVAHHQNGPEQG